MRALYKDLERSIFTFMPRYVRHYYYYKCLENVKFPEVINIEDTNACNASCVMCPREKLTRPIGFMDFRLYKKLIDECSERIEIKEIHLNGFGESLLDKELVEKVAYAKNKRIKRIYFVTNASLLNPDLGESLIKSGLDGIKFSIYGATKETYEKIHRGLDFDIAESNIMSFFKLREKLGFKKPYIKMQFISQDENINERTIFFKKWSKFIKKESGDMLLDFKIHNWTDGRDYNKRQDLRNLKSCALPFFCAQILWNLDAGACCYDFNGVLKFGNLKDRSLEEIWNGDLYTRFREIHRSGDFSKIPTCEDCDQLRMI